VDEAHYRPLDAQKTPRFAGVRTFMRMPLVQDRAGVDAAALGIPFDTATSFRSGARFGPEAIRSASSLLRPFHPGFEIELTEELSIVDWGDLPVAPGDTTASLGLIEAGLAPLVEAGIFVLAMGGDHSITLGELRALARVHGPLALLQFDAHTDTWDEYFGQKLFHGTTFRRAVEERLIDPHASVQAGIRGSLYGPSDLAASRELGFEVLTSADLRSQGTAGFASLTRERTAGRPVFVSFDIDFLDPAYAPGTGTPEIAGFTTTEAVGLLRALRGVPLAGCDIVEVSPAYDGSGQPTALAAANILWELIGLRAVAAD
jgi:agmatinase